MRDQGRFIFSMGACVWQCLFQQAVLFVIGGGFSIGMVSGLKITYCVKWLCFCLSICLWVQESASAAFKRWWDFITPSASAGKALLCILIAQAPRQEMLEQIVCPGPSDALQQGCGEAGTERRGKSPL